MAEKENHNCKIKKTKLALITIAIVIILLTLSNTANAITQPSKVIVTTNRYALWAPHKNDQGANGSTFHAYALIVDSKGKPISGEPVTFNIYSANGLVSTQSATTAANGIAYITYDVSNDITQNSDPDSGQWNVEAHPTNYPSITASTTTWYSADKNCRDLCHENKISDAGGYPKSPYNDKFGQTQTRSEKAHTKNAHNNKPCTYCHAGYDKEAGTYKPVGTHSTKYCTDCHTGMGTNGILNTDAAQTNGGIPDMPDCYDCHPNNNNKLTSISTLGTVSGFSGVSIFSWNLNAPEVAHTTTGNSLTQGVPCVICHGPMHNTSKPVLQGTTNNHTEDTQCTSCHVNQSKHSPSNPVYCTACHSQDAHAIKVLGTDGTYKNLDSPDAITNSTADCTKCHNSGAPADYLANLTTTDPQAYTTNYNPDGLYYAQHPTADCTNSCHDTTDFHNIGRGGGPECINCHGTNGTANHRIDENAMAQGIHANLNHQSGDPNEKCWGCHQSNGTQPSDMGDKYNNPYKCPDCHINTPPYPNVANAPKVSEHYKNGSDIKVLTNETNNTASCIRCHNKNEMKTSYSEPDTLNTNLSLTSHYGKKRTDLHNATETNCSYCHQNTTTTFQDVFTNTANTNITHNGGTPCTTCHGAGRIHNETLTGGAGGDCANNNCHGEGGLGKTINTTNLGLHTTLNNTDGGLTQYDCRTCHYAEPHGGQYTTNTYLCEDCHTPDGNGPTPSTLQITNFKHGLNTCKDCHAATEYHTGNPRGTVANPGWNLIDPASYTGCNDCHYTHNGQDEPFHAPGKDHYNTGSTCSFSCHGTNTHSVSAITGISKLTIDSLSLDKTKVNESETVTLTVTASDNMMQVEVMRYRLRSGAGVVVVPWSDLVPVDGGFDSKSETGTVVIDTSGLHGNYTVEVRVMAGAPRNVSGLRYYPDNGDWSTVESAVLTVVRPGYIDAGAVDEQGYLWSAKRSGLLGSDRFDFGGTPETTVRFESDGDIVYRFGWLNNSALYKVNLTLYQKAYWWFGEPYPTGLLHQHHSTANHIRRKRNPTLRHRNTRRIPRATKHPRQQHHRQLRIQSTDRKQQPRTKSTLHRRNTTPRIQRQRHHLAPRKNTKLTNNRETTHPTKKRVWGVIILFLDLLFLILPRMLGN
jgi:hypothetical protein